VKGYAAHERETFEAVTQARTRAQAAEGPAAQGQAEGLLSQALGRLFAVAEAYPELQADENFRQLQDELAQTENRIAVSRQVYNDTVLTYNTAIQTVPGVFVAKPFGFGAREFFEVEDEAAREAPRVAF
jgi:LemA protein